MSEQASGLLQVRGFQLFDLQRVTALQNLQEKRLAQCNIRKEWVPSLWHWLMHNCVGLLCCSLHIEPAREDPLQPGILKICRESPQAVAGTRTGTQRVRMSVGCFMFQRDYD